MKYVSIDCETSGLNPEKCQVLSIGAVVEDTNNLLPLEELPTFHCAILHNEIHGELFALNMNKDLMSKIVEYQTAKGEAAKEAVEKKYNMIFRKEKDAVVEFWKFLIRSKVIEFDLELRGHIQWDVENECSYPLIGPNTPVSHITVAGKNFATFDKLFLERLPRWKQLFKIRQRTIDPTILYTSWSTDESLPNLSTCKNRAGLGTTVTHNADEDAMDIIKLMRKQYESEN